MSECEFEGGYESVYPVALVALAIGQPQQTVRHWFRHGLLGDGCYIETPGRWKAKGQLCLGPAAILAAASVKHLRRYSESLSTISRMTSWLSNLTMKDLELAAKHDQVLICAEDLEPQLVGADHEIFTQPWRDPKVLSMRIAPTMPTLRRALKILDAVTNEVQL